MEIKEIALRNMICSRCLKVVKQNLKKIGVEVLDIRLGKLTIKYPQEEVSISEVEQTLLEDDFEFIKDKDTQITEQLKLSLIQKVNQLPLIYEERLSDYLTKILNRDYWTLSKTFSKIERITLEKYFILLKIEKVKELIE